MPRDEEDISAFNVPWYLITAIYIAELIVAFAVWAVLTAFWGDLVLMDSHELWKPEASIAEALGKVWFIFLLGAGLTLIAGFFVRNEPRQANPSTVLFKGWWISLNAGIFEELIFRWLIFFGAMITVRFMDWITFGAVKWFSLTINIPLANWATFGALEPQLKGSDWVFGAAIIAASVKFRDAHEYLGFLGWISSWFGGMVMFYLMFNYGLASAMVAHVLYDVVAFTAAAIVTAWQPKASYNPFERLMSDIFSRSRY